MSWKEMLSGTGTLMLTGVLCSCGGQDARRPGGGSTETAVTSARAFTDAEQAFAARVARDGIGDGFLAFLADSGIVFRPRAVNGKASYGSAPGGSGVLAWYPILAESSLEGDLGYTTGPWTYRAEPADAVSARGYYLTIWQRQPDGSLKVMLDIGTEGTPADSLATLPTPQRPGFARQPLAGTRADHASSLRAAENGVDAGSGGMAEGDALAPYLAGDARYNDNGNWSRGDSAVIQDVSRVAIWRFHGMGVSAAGDLGYTYGEYWRPGSGSLAGSQGNYVRVWMRRADGAWRVVLAVAAKVAGG